MGSARAGSGERTLCAKVARGPRPVERWSVQVRRGAGVARGPRSCIERLTSKLLCGAVSPLLWQASVREKCVGGGGFGRAHVAVGVRGSDLPFPRLLV